MTEFEKFHLKLIKTLKYLVTLSPVQTPNRGFAPGPHWKLPSPRSGEYAGGGEGVPEHPLS